MIGLDCASERRVKCFCLLCLATVQRTHGSGVEFEAESERKGVFAEVGSIVSKRTTGLGLGWSGEGKSYLWNWIERLCSVFLLVWERVGDARGRVIYMRLSVGDCARARMLGDFLGWRDSGMNGL
jgi:hypothetical protein